MDFKELLTLINEDLTINSNIALSEISLLPKLVRKDGRLMVEVYYLKSDLSLGRYTVYPVSHKVLYDIESKKAVEIKNVALKNIDYGTPLGTYQNLLNKNGIENSKTKEYEDLFTEVFNKGNDADNRALKILSALWEQCIPNEIKNTIV